LKPSDIRTKYKTLEPIISLDESFLDKFEVDYKYFDELMEYWFIREERPVKEGEIYIPTLYLKRPY
jgi:hypothetical protein